MPQNTLYHIIHQPHNSLIFNVIGAASEDRKTQRGRRETESHWGEEIWTNTRIGQSDEEEKRPSARA